MRLQDRPLTGKMSIIMDSSTPNKLPSSKQQSEVNRPRKILLILIITLLVFCFINFVFILISFATNHSPEDQTSKSISQLLSVLLSALYYGFGFLVTYRYHRIGLLVFAWLGLISLITLAVITLIALIIVLGSSNMGFLETIVGAIVVIIICLIGSLLQIVTVRYAFVLSKLLKKTKPLITARF